jgi:hypothetical protein
MVEGTVQLMVSKEVDAAFPTRQRPARNNLKQPRRPTRFERWAWSPITAFRIGLTLGYIWLVYLGISAYIAGSPTFNLTAPNGWTPIWAVVVSASAGAAAIGSVSANNKIFHRIELAGSWGLTITLGVYAVCILILAYAAGDTSKVTAAAAYVGIFIPPALRMLWLMAQLGRKPIPATAPVAITGPGQEQGNV